MAQQEAVEQSYAADVSTEASAEQAGAAAKTGHLPEIPVAEVVQVHSQEDVDRVLSLHEAWTRAVLDPNCAVASGRANLKGADLRGYRLSGVNLSGANLSGANLSGCDLEGANLTVANLEKANLSGCNLSGAKLRRARLDGADLSSADLTGALLTGVDMSKVVLTPAAATLADDRPGASVKASLSPPEVDF